jgi:lysophospholipase L1-like esterase
MPDTSATGLPRVLLIGDSITRSYYAAVEAKLKGKAYCARIATSKAVGDPALPRQIATFIREEKFDIIHFNIGMHGWDYSEADYRKYLPELLRTIRKSAPNAKLIWASTTPVRADRDPGPTNARIIARNQIAQRFFTARHIPIDDLWTAMKPYPQFHSDDVHFNKDGVAILADHVAAEIEKLLPEAGR